ncbi:Uma2 family endonuclease [Candidatus Halobeggiatoa sp. HSG11]|nr:Uma2 family endonuclease [Candidatus Halobeggiatoa sp. HSG11]
MIQLEFNQIVMKPGQVLLLRDINWQKFETILDDFGETRATRFSYSKGMLEIMAPLAVHETGKKIIGNMVEIILEELDIEFWALGSTTFKNEEMAQGIEADECFYIENEAVVRGKDRIDLVIDPPPDLAIEIDISSRTRFDNYEELGVRELWRFDGESLEISVLQDGRYVISDDSFQFPNIPVAEAIPRYLQKSKVDGRNVTMRAFRAWVRGIIDGDEY